MSSQVFSNRLWKDESAFSVFEMLIVIALLSILTAVGVVNYSEFRNSFDRSNSIKQLEFDIRRAKTLAVKEGTRGILAMVDGGSSYTFGYDYLPFTAPAVADTQTFRQSLPSSVTVSFETPLIFDSRGYLIGEYGSLKSQKVTLSQNGSTFSVMEVFPTGAIQHE